MKTKKIIAINGILMASSIILGVIYDRRQTRKWKEEDRILEENRKTIAHLQETAQTIVKDLDLKIDIAKKALEGCPKIEDLDL